MYQGMHELGDRDGQDQDCQNDQNEVEVESIGLARQVSAGSPSQVA
jgi:hypothetical protein